VVISGPVGNFIYTWSTGDTEQFIELTSGSLPVGSNQIALTVIDTLGCSSTDSLLVQVEVCLNTPDLAAESGSLIFPNPCNSKIWIVSPQVAEKSLDSYLYTGGTIGSGTICRRCSCGCFSPKPRTVYFNCCLKQPGNSGNVFEKLIYAYKSRKEEGVRRKSAQRLTAHLQNRGFSKRFRDSGFVLHLDSQMHFGQNSPASPMRKTLS